MPEETSGGLQEGTTDGISERSPGKNVERNSGETPEGTP